MEFIGRILPVFVGWLIWRKSGNIIIGAVVAMVLEGIIGPILKELRMLFVKKQHVQELEAFPLQRGEGLRILIIRKENIERSPLEIVAEMKQKLSNNPKFVQLWRAVEAGNLPVHHSMWEFKKFSIPAQTKAFRIWRGMGDVAEVLGKEIRDDYFYEARSSTAEYAAAFCFAQNILWNEETV